MTPDPSSTAPRPTRVTPVSLGDLAALDARLVLAGADAGVLVTGATLRGQDTRPGDLFAALPGRRTHGAAHAAAAVAAGAVAVLTDPEGAETAAECGAPLLVHPDPRAVLGVLAAEIHGRPSDHLRVVGITGTAGKTTTAYLVEAGLRRSGRTTGLLGTVETRVDGTALPSAFTTPEAPDLQALLAVMVERGVTDVVMEVSSHALALGRVVGTRFAVGAFTNLSHEHLDFHPDMDDYFRAKALLFDPASPVAATTAVVCSDGEWGARMAAVAGDGVVTTSGGAGPADWTATGAGQRVQVVGPAGTTELALRLPGAFNVTNAVLALAVLQAVGVDLDTTSAALGEVDVPGRMERVDRGGAFTAVVDYAHKPAALSAVIEALRAGLPAGSAGRLAVVVGAGGDRDTAKRPLMGEVAARGADLLVVTDDNPRSEDPAGIRAEVLAGARAVPDAARAEIREEGDRAAAIGAAVAWARPGDVVLVAGKGHETGQEVLGVKHPFDDRSTLAEALEALAPAHEQQEVAP